MADTVTSSSPETSVDPMPAVMPRTVALFMSCAADLAMSRVVTAARQILEILGVEVVVPATQSCCGQVALNSGHPGPAAGLARHWVRTFAPFDAVVSPSGSCVATVHHGVQRLAREQPWVADARDLARRTYELTQFLAAYGGHLPLSLEATVAWHDSCHMLRTLGEKRSPRVVLERIEGLRFHEVADAESCCGFGGSFATKFPELSCAMADRKLRSAADAGVTHLASADPGCLLHLGGRAARSGTGIAAVHVAELVRDALPGTSERSA